MKNVTETYIILGGGLTGLSFAYGKLRKNHSVIVLEKNSHLGGIMRPFVFKDFIFDFGPHVFRSNDKNIMRFIKSLLYGNFHHISSNPKIYKQGKIFDNVIPCITLRNIIELDEHKREKILRELKNLPSKIDLGNFENTIISQIGETLYYEFFGEYSRKWWGMDPKELSSDIAPKNLRIGTKEPSYAHITTKFRKISEEIYPSKDGIFGIIKALAHRIKVLGGDIKTNFNVKSLELDGENISAIVVENKEEELELSARECKIISTIPLTILCDMLNIKCNLLYRADICIFIKLKARKIFDFSWVYFHDRDIIFSRIYEPQYFSKYNVPKGFTSLCVEVTCFKNDNIWRDRYLSDKVLSQLLDLRIIKENYKPEILGIAKYPYAYPIYTIDYKQKLKHIYKELGYIKNLEVIGRTGSFRYINMEGCIKWAIY